MPEFTLFSCIYRIIVTISFLELGHVTSILHCPDGWVQHHGTCYLFSTTKSQWGSAWSICQSLHANLVEIEDANEDQFLRNNLITAHRTGVFFTGGNDFESENEYIWSSSRQRVSYTNWATGNPNSVSQPGEDCISMAEPDWKWHDSRCDASFYFICEITLETGSGGEQVIG